jgi:hypothetical protein
MSHEDSARPTRALLWLSLLQGACLYYLYAAVQGERWPATVPAWHFPLCTLAVISPLVLQLSVTRNNWKGVSRDTVLLSTLLALLGTYAGSQAQPFSAFPTGSLVTVYAATMFIASFKAVIHIQRRAEGVGLSYSSLFTNSWRTFLIGVLAGVFAMTFWLLLLLWGALFSSIGVSFFARLFRQEWFAIPTLTFAFGIGVLLFRSNTRVIDSITQLLHSLIKLLLPLLLALATVFLLALLFTGLQPLWDTGSGTALLLWLLALMLFFVNAVYQDGRQANPYPVVLHRLIYLGICTAPIISVLAFYGLFLRLQDYGWTVERCWAFVVWLLLSLFALGYVLGVVRRRDAWTDELARTNTVMSLVLLGLMLLANSPFLDFRKVALASQINRVEAGDIELADFDFWYARQHLARPGYRYMEQLREEARDSNPELLAALDNPTWRPRPMQDTQALWESMRYRPAGMSVPPALRPVIDASLSPMPGQAAVLLAQDLDGDGSDEYLLLQLGPGGSAVLRAQFFYEEDQAWRAGVATVASVDSDDVLTALLERPVELREKRFRDVDVGGIRISLEAPRRE